MKKVEQLAQALSLKTLCGGEGLSREITGGVYCCDLLSIVMGRAPAGGVWVTVMGNVNAVAVAVLCDLACIIVAEGMQVDAMALEKARDQGVVVFSTDRPIYETARAADLFLDDGVL